MTADTDHAPDLDLSPTPRPHSSERARAGVIGAPRLAPHVLQRERLRTLLDRQPRPALTVLQAGSGFGKSSLLASWAGTGSPSSGITIWVTADDAVRDGLSFWKEVLHLLDQAGLVKTTEFRHVDPRGDIADILHTRLRRGFASLDEPVTLVVDGFERLAGSTVEDDLIELLTRTDMLYLIVATHVPSKITQLVTATALDTVFIDASDLRFSGEEVIELANATGVHTAAAELHRLADSLDGWPFGVRAMLEYQRRASLETRPENAIFERSLLSREPLDVSFIHRHLLDSLADVAGLESLEVTTVLDSFTLSEAAWLGAVVEDDTVLAELESRGLGTWHGEDQTRSFRIHPVLRTALRQRLDVEPGAATSAYERLAQWHADQCDFARAFEAAVRAEKWDLAARCLRSDLFGVLARLRLHPTLMARIPRRIFKGEPLMMLIDGVTLYGRGNQTKAIRAFLSAIAACERQRVVNRGEIAPEQVWVQGVLTVALRLVGRYELVPSALKRFNRMLDAVEDPSGDLDRSMVLIRSQTVMTLSLLDRLDAAEQFALVAIEEKHEMSPLQHASMHGLSAFAHARRGNVVLASGVLNSLDPADIPEQFDDSFFAVTHHIASALVAIERFDPEAAIERLDLTNRHWPTMEYWPFVLEARVRAEWQRRGAHIALLTLREGQAQKLLKAPIGAPMTGMLAALEAELLLASTSVADASTIISSNRVRRFPRLSVPKSRSLLLVGKWEEAAAFAETHVQVPALSWSARADLLLIAACASLRLGDRHSAEERFNRACEIASDTGVRTPFAAMPRDDLNALATADARPFSDVLSRQPTYPAPTPAASLSRREQVVLSQLAGDTPLAEVAQTLRVSVNTLKSQVRSIYRKLDVSSRTEAVQVARQRGLLLFSVHHGKEEEHH